MLIEDEDVSLVPLVVKGGMRNHSAWPACNSIIGDKNVNTEYYSN